MEKTLKRFFLKRHVHRKKARLQNKDFDAKGAFYSFPFAKNAIDTLYKNGKIKKNDDITFSEYLLDSKGVAVVPGSAFGAENYFRISFATSMDNLKEALSRIKEAIED